MSRPDQTTKRDVQPSMLPRTAAVNVTIWVEQPMLLTCQGLSALQTTVQCWCQGEHCTLSAARMLLQPPVGQV